MSGEGGCSSHLGSREGAAENDIWSALTVPSPCTLFLLQPEEAGGPEPAS